MENHVNWPTAMGARVLINDGWYKFQFVDQQGFEELFALSS